MQIYLEVLSQMFSRRLLRIKIMQALYAFHKAGDKTIEAAEKELNVSLTRTYYLYHLLLLLIIDLAFYARKKIDMAREKKIPSSKDLNPNTNFIDNHIIAQLEHNEHLTRYLQSHSLSWVQNPELIKALFQKIEESETYNKYMGLTKPDYEQDRQFVIDLYQDVINEYDPLYQVLEEQSIYWNDEVDFIIMMIIKTLRDFSEDQKPDSSLMPEFRDEEDEEFTHILFRKTILKKDESLEYIKKYTENWDPERLAFIDLLLMQMAICEMIEFPFIPTKVTLNEYIDISKYYSTRNSNVFINGVLDKITHFLKEDKKIIKKGKGLIGETN
jgi:N utilization substance protein B